jgi:hypothetical protein
MKLLTLGEVASHFGIQLWQVRRVFQRGLLPEPDRIGVIRVIPTSLLPTIGQTLRAAGYLK